MIEPFSIIEILEKRKSTSAKIAENVKVGDILRVSIELSLRSTKPMIVISKYSGIGDYKDSSSFTYISRTKDGNFYKIYTDDEEDPAPILFKEISKKSLLKGILYKTIEKTIEDSSNDLQNIAYLIANNILRLSQVSLPVPQNKNFDLKKEVQITVNSKAFNYIETLDDAEWNDRSRVFKEFKEPLTTDIFNAVVAVLLNAGYQKDELGI